MGIFFERTNDKQNSKLVIFKGLTISFTIVVLSIMSFFYGMDDNLYFNLVVSLFLLLFGVEQIPKRKKLAYILFFISTVFIFVNFLYPLVSEAK